MYDNIQLLYESSLVQLKVKFNSNIMIGYNQCCKTSHWTNGQFGSVGKMEYDRRLTPI